jgi:hypothetical protein
VENTLDPVWDNVVEFCTADYTKTVVSLVLHDKDVTTLETLRIKDDPDDFMGSCNFYLTKVHVSKFFLYNVKFYLQMFLIGRTVEN